ncbi:unnamed protein product [Protopolystoma xenopodis]|uniref:Uncharacterized protein n=1 Tax=Protopolystoma xenopodis TaxID=117903 RepID=A0A448WA60_9PLAT|nr:unnamed protein product [Protopolystoma xenopodis]
MQPGKSRRTRRNQPRPLPAVSRACSSTSWQISRWETMPLFVSAVGDLRNINTNSITASVSGTSLDTSNQHIIEKALPKETNTMATSTLLRLTKRQTACHGRPAGHMPMPFTIDTTEQQDKPLSYISIASPTPPLSLLSPSSGHFEPNQEFNPSVQNLSIITGEIQHDGSSPSFSEICENSLESKKDRRLSHTDLRLSLKSDILCNAQPEVLDKLINRSEKFSDWLSNIQRPCLFVDNRKLFSEYSSLKYHSPPLSLIESNGSVTLLASNAMHDRNDADKTDDNSDSPSSQSDLRSSMPICHKDSRLKRSGNASSVGEPGCDVPTLSRPVGQELDHVVGFAEELVMHDTPNTEVPGRPCHRRKEYDTIEAEPLSQLEGEHFSKNCTPCGNFRHEIKRRDVDSPISDRIWKERGGLGENGHGDGDTAGGTTNSVDYGGSGGNGGGGGAGGGGGGGGETGESANGGSSGGGGGGGGLGEGSGGLGGGCAGHGGCGGCGGNGRRGGGRGSGSRGDYVGSGGTGGSSEGGSGGGSSQDAGYNMSTSDLGRAFNQNDAVSADAATALADHVYRADELLPRQYTHAVSSRQFDLTADAFGGGATTSNTNDWSSVSSSEWGDDMCVS